MSSTTAPALVEALRDAVYPLRGTGRDYDPLVDLVGDARFVLLGEASHGTHEFYRERARITKRLIVQREQEVGPKSRLFEFPVEIDTENVRATLDHGILKIHVPKAAAGRRRIIRIGQ